MIAIKCVGCGRPLEISEAERRREIVCPGCGCRQSPGAAEECAPAADAKESSEGATLCPPPVDRPSVATPLSESTAETLTPMSADGTEPFPFLAPSDPGSGDLGRLGHYRILRLLGKGGMGAVFEAIDTHLQRKVALKVMKPEIALDEQARKRFLREAQATAAVRSDHIVVIHHVEHNGNTPYLAMEFLRGEPLDRWMLRRGRLSLEESLRVAVEIARGLADAHEAGLIHRDIKPANIWLESPSGRVKILDFGLARLTQDQAHLTRNGVVMGTPAYMAPEQAEGGEVTPRSDLFSLGCVLYEMVAGRPPFTGANSMAILLAVTNKTPPAPRKFNPELPSALSDLIMRLLTKDPNKRPASAQEVVETLEAIAQQHGFGRFTPSSGQTRVDSRARPASASWRPGRRQLIAALAILGVLLVVVWVARDMARQRAAPGPVASGKMAPGVTRTDILLGMTGPFSGPSRELGRDMELGLRTYFRTVNDAGGVNGRKIDLLALDDGYEPKEALVRVKELYDWPVFAVIGSVGTPTAQVTVPFTTAKKMVFFGALSGAKFLRKDPPNRYVFNYRASYAEETSRIVHYLLDVRHVKPSEIAVFSQNDSFGDAGFEGVEKMLRGKVGNIVHVRYERNTIQVDKAVKTILAHPEIRAVVLVATYRPAARFIRLLKDDGRDLIYACISFVGSEALAAELKDAGEGYVAGIIVTQVVPPIDSDATIVMKYRDNLRKYFPSERASFTSLEGYITAALFVAGLQKAGPDLTTDALIDGLESIHDFDLGTGAKLGFSASEHQASHKVWGTMLDKDGNFREIDLD